MGRKNPITNFFDGFNSAYKGVRQIAQDSETGDVMNAKQEQVVTHTPDQLKSIQDIIAAKDQDGNAHYSVQKSDDGSVSITPNVKAEGVDQSPINIEDLKGKVTTKFLGKEYDKPLTDTQERSARHQALSGIYGKYGDHAGSLRSESIAKSLSEQADDEAVRDVIKKGLPTTPGQPGSPMQPADQNTVAAIAKRGTGLVESPKTQLDAYLESIAPKVKETLAQQGRIDEANKYSKFIETEQGKAYAKEWSKGIGLLGVGDHKGALGVFENMYNRQIYNDGRTVKLDPLEGGKHYQMTIMQGDQVIGTKKLATSELTHVAASALAPEKYVQSQLRQQYALERQANRPTRGNNPTLTQQARNLEIDSARDQVSGLSPEDIRSRTAKTTDTGRENPNYDPALARNVTLASRRKVGTDEAFDQRNQSNVAPTKAQPNQIASKFASDPTVRGMSLGNRTPKGFEVFDSNGKLIGHYN